MRTIAPISAVIATRNRLESLRQTLESLLLQDLLPEELIVVDSSANDDTRNAMAKFEKRMVPGTSVRWISAEVGGAAPQRNQGVAVATQPFIWFFDDDVHFEPGCAERLWRAIECDPKLGGVNAMIVNQRYYAPGLVSRVMFRLMHGRKEVSYAGKIIGPAINLLPEDRDDLPEVVQVEWLNTTCTLFRREALPAPVFDAFFVGYSLMEDVALSLRVAQRGWKLANARTARIVHQSQPGDHKSKVRAVARMEVINRYYVMRNILEQRGPLAIFRFALWQIFQVISVAAQPCSRRKAVPILLGQVDALTTIISGAKS